MNFVGAQGTLVGIFNHVHPNDKVTTSYPSATYLAGRSKPIRYKAHAILSLQRGG